MHNALPKFHPFPSNKREPQLTPLFRKWWLRCNLGKTTSADKSYNETAGDAKRLLTFSAVHFPSYWIWTLGNEFQVEFLAVKDIILTEGHRIDGIGLTVVTSGTGLLFLRWIMFFSLNFSRLMLGRSGHDGYHSIGLPWRFSRPERWGSLYILCRAKIPRIPSSSLFSSPL